MRIEHREGVAALHGHCRVADAETLASLLQQSPGITLDVSGCESLHAAVVQAILAFRPPVVGAPADPFLKNHLLTALAREAAVD